MRQSQVLWSLVLLLGLWCSVEAAWKIAVRGKFSVNPGDGYQCEYVECNKPGGGKRLFQVLCKHGTSTYGCIYEGNPHNCAAYNNNGQKKYYGSLGTKSGNGRPNGCSYWKLWSNNMCKDIIFVKVVPSDCSVYKSPAPNWCDFSGSELDLAVSTVNCTESDVARFLPLSPFCLLVFYHVLVLFVN